MANAKRTTEDLMKKRNQVAEAVQQGYLDGAIAADLTTAINAGYIPNNRSADSELTNFAIAGINR